MTAHPAIGALAFAIATMAAGSPSPAEEPAAKHDAARAARMAEMGEVARSLKATRSAGGAATPIPLQPEPLFRWSEAVREIRDGRIWAWGRQGRPAALVAIEFIPLPKGELVWALEFVSLSTGPLLVEGGPGFRFDTRDDVPLRADAPFRWAPRTAGVEFAEIAEAPAPAADEGARLRQMKEILMRFSAREETAVRITLRPLPRPIHRYADPASGLIDGAIFAFVSGTNPEALLVIEAQERPPGRAAWRFAAVPLTSARVTLALDQKDAWTKPHPIRTLAEEAYFTARKPRRPPASPDSPKPGP